MKGAAGLALVVALLGAPLFLALFAGAWVGYRSADLDPILIWVEVYHRVMENPLFVTIPLFCLAGLTLSEGSTTRRLIDLFAALFGWLPGGAVVVGVGTAAIFTAFTGASGVTIVALGGFLIPLLEREGFGGRFNLGLVTTSGSLGLLFPPALPVIVFGLVVSGLVPIGIEALFTAALVPGLVLLLMLWGFALIRRPRDAVRSPFSSRALLTAARGAAVELPLLMLLGAGLLGGFLTTVQAAGGVALGAVVVSIVVRQDIRASGLPGLAARSAVLAAAILCVIMAAMALTNLMTYLDVPQSLLRWLENGVDDPVTFLILLNVLLLLVGCAMDIYSAILIVVPILYPVAMRFGIDPVHLAVIILVNLEIGYCTPPVGLNLFIASLRFQRPLGEVWRAAAPFCGVLLLFLFLVTWWPGLSLGFLSWREGSVTATVRWAPVVQAGAQAEAAWRRRGADDDLDPERHGTVGDASPRGLDDVVVAIESDAATGVTIRVTAGASLSFSAAPGALESGRQVDAALHGFGDGLDPAFEGLGSEAFGAVRLDIDSVTDATCAGRLRFTTLRFPEDPDAPEIVHDVVVAWTAPRTVEAPRRPGTGARTRRIRGVVVERRDEGRFAIETLRPRPHRLALVGVPGSTATLGLVLEDADAAWRGARLEGRGRMERGPRTLSVIGRLRDPASGAMVDVEVVIPHPR